MILLALGCAYKLGPPEVAYAPATASVDLVHPSNDHQRWYLPAQVEGVGERIFFLDTGYSYSTCDDDFVAALGLKTKGRVMVKGELGRIRATKANLPPMQIGGHRVEGLTCLVRDLNATSSIRDPSEVAIGGVVGIDLLRRFHTVVDPASGTVTLSDPRTEKLDKKASDVVRLKREYKIGIRMLVPIGVGDRTVWPIVDTGASGTHLDGDRLGLTPTIENAEVVMRGSGSTSAVVKELAFYEEDVRIANSRLGPVVLTDRKRGPYAPGLLGLNVLANYRQEYDFDRGLARYTPVDPAVVPSWRRWSRLNGDEPPGFVFVSE